MSYKAVRGPRDRLWRIVGPDGFPVLLGVPDKATATRYAELMNHCAARKRELRERAELEDE